jgi:hypothetical protein
MSDTYYDPMSGLPMGGLAEQPDPTQGLPPWAMGTLAQQLHYEPQGTMWPDPNARAPAPQEKPDPLVPFSAWRADPPQRTAGTVAADVGAKLIPTSPLDVGLTIATGGGNIPVRMAALAAGAALDPDEAQAGKARLFSSPFSKIGHTSPVHDTEYAMRLRNVQRPELPAAAVEGSYLLPLAGDRAAAMGDILGIGGQRFEMPTWLQGGRDYPLEMAGKGAAWASEKPAVTRLLNRAQEADAPVYGVYSAMGERSIDFSHHVSDTLVSMAQHAPITDSGLARFDAVMRETDPNWPGILSHRAQDYLASAPGGLRVKLAKEMDKAEYRDAGFPRVDQARFAATDPGLVDVPLAASGGSVSRLTGERVNEDFLPRHRTYRSVMGGDYQGQFGHVPVDVMFPDLTAAHLAARPDMRLLSPEARNAAHLSMFMKAGGDVPMLQKATPQWVERLSRWQEANRMGDLARQ